MEGLDVTLRVGLPEEMRRRAARLYLDAFDKKLGPILGRDRRAVAYLEDILRPSQALVAVDRYGVLLGLAGFHTDHGGLVGGSFGDLYRWYGLWGACWRSTLMAFFTRAPQSGQLLMDGVVVSPECRGKGVGSKLLEGVEQIAKAQELEQVRLDVVDTNPRARALYERKGFVPAGEEGVWPFHWLFGFRRSITMVKAV